MRIILAFLIAPASFGLLLFGLSLFTSTVAESLPVLLFVAMIGYPIATVLGIPVYFIMSKIGANGFLSYTLISLIFTALIVGYFIIRSIYLENDGNLSTLLSEPRVLQMVIIAFASFFTVSVFWLIARPDRAAA
jgi:hypothetical protein